MVKRGSILDPAALAAGLLLATAAQAQISDNVVKIGVLNDMSGLYADVTGMSTVEAVRMAIEDFGGKVKGAPIELIYADHQNKPDVGVSIARKWIDVEKVDAIVDVPGSSIALGVQEVTREANRVFINTGSGSTALSGAKCSPTAVQWTYDTYALAQGIGAAGVQKLGDTWFFLTVDYSFGQAMEKDIAAVVTANGGKVLGSTRHPLNAGDFSSFLLKAQSSGAKVVAFANASTDAVNAVKQAQEFGLPQSGQVIAAPLMLITDVHALGLKSAQGLMVVDAFNPERDEDSRAFTKRYMDRTKRMPSMVQAAAYSAVGHYLKAIEATGTDEAKTVIARMREVPVNDAFAKGARLRPDGRLEHDMYLMRVKAPAESKHEWDLTTVVATIPASQATRPLAESDCPLLKDK
ncbi:ABC transporter substrate-binding protein [Xanthobacter sp. 126]|jgi:branched-chain amino acid transport system substrate-binding protein|uniref:ABC transporter substrate-binding protein n=1 Tax=Xanthobacter sp. 126 TaxID=1131814 RepID=UPI00045EC472|nr:ABC transporter substrate-binding protein [Xanthobacter sp. 126]